MSNFYGDISMEFKIGFNRIKIFEILLNEFYEDWLRNLGKKF